MAGVMHSGSGDISVGIEGDILVLHFTNPRGELMLRMDKITAARFYEMMGDVGEVFFADAPEDMN